MRSLLRSKVDLFDKVCYYRSMDKRLKQTNNEYQSEAAVRLNIAVSEDDGGVAESQGRRIEAKRKRSLKRFGALALATTVSGMAASGVVLTGKAMDHNYEQREPNNPARYQPIEGYEVVEKPDGTVVKEFPQEVNRG